LYTDTTTTTTTTVLMNQAKIDEAKKDLILYTEVLPVYYY